MSFIRNLAGIDYSNSNSFNEFAKISDNFFIKNKKADISDDDDFLKLEEEANKDFGDEQFDDNDDNSKSSNLSSFDTSDEKNKLKFGPNYGRPKIYFSSDENSDLERDTSYMTNYIKSILTADLFRDFKKAQEKGIPIFKLIEIPESVKRPFQISQDYSELIVDMMNEMIESDDLRNTDYVSYIEKLTNLFLTENHEAQKFKEESHKNVMDAYNKAFTKSCGLDCAEFIFSKSDDILKEQLCDVIGLCCERKPETSELETVIIDLNYSPRKKKSKKLETSPILLKNGSPVTNKNQLKSPKPPLIRPSPPPYSPPPSPPGSPRANTPNQPLKSPEPPLIRPSPPPYSPPPSPPGSPRANTSNQPSKNSEPAIKTSQSPPPSLKQLDQHDSLLDSLENSQADSLVNSQVDSLENSQADSLFESGEQSQQDSLFGSPIQSPIESPNRSLIENPQEFLDEDLQTPNVSLGMIDDGMLEEQIKAAMPEDIFNKMSLIKKEGKLPDMIPNDQNEEIIDFINFYAQMDNLPDFTYEQYIQHLIDSYLNSGEEEEEEFINDNNMFSKDNFSDDKI